jgi:hypothetical protein
MFASRVSTYINCLWWLRLLSLLFPTRYRLSQKGSERDACSVHKKRFVYLWVLLHYFWNLTSSSVWCACASKASHIFAHVCRLSKGISIDVSMFVVASLSRIWSTWSIQSLWPLLCLLLSHTSKLFILQVIQCRFMSWSVTAKHKDRLLWVVCLVVQNYSEWAKWEVLLAARLHYRGFVFHVTHLVRITAWSRRYLKFPGFLYINASVGPRHCSSTTPLFIYDILKAIDATLMSCWEEARG